VIYNFVILIVHSLVIIQIVKDARYMYCNKVIII